LGFYLFQGIEMQTDFMHEAFDSDPKHHFSLTTVLQGPQHKMC